MARRRAKILSERELEVMNAVWKLGKASVKDVRSVMGGEKAGAYTSIATMLKFLESKGVLKHIQEGRTFYYTPQTSKENEQKKALEYVLESYFDGDISFLLRTLNHSSESAEDVAVTETPGAQPLYSSAYSED